MSRGSRLLATLGLLALIAASVMLWPRDRSEVPLEAAQSEPASFVQSTGANATVPSGRTSADSIQDATAATGSRELAESSWSFRGQVLKEKRAPLERFGVLATRMGTVGNVLEQLETPLENHAEGRFELSGLTPGHWVIAPFAPERKLVLERNFWERDEVEWSYLLLLSDPSTLKPRSAAVKGIVLLPSGELAVDAFVTARRDLDDDPSRWGSELAQASALTGTFTLRLDPGEWTLVARAKGSNPSVPVRVTSVEGLPLNGVRLQLEPACAVRFLIAAEIPARPRPLELSWRAVGSRASGTVEGYEGREFEVPIEGGRTIEWTVRCPPDEPMVGRFEVPERATSHAVRLERLTPDPVRLVVSSGLLLQDSAAISGDPAMGLLPAVRTEFDEGTRELRVELPRPGRWLLRMRGSDGHFLIDVPDVPVHETVGPPQPTYDY